MISKVKMLPKNNRLRQLIKDHGEIWEVDVKSGPHHMLCFNGQLGLAIKSLNVTKGHRDHHRNILMSDVEVIHES